VVITDGVPGSPQQIAGTDLVSDVACATASNCFAAAQTHDGGTGIVPITDGVAGSYMPMPKTDGGIAGVNHLGCISATERLAITADAALMLTDGTTPGSWVRGPQDPGLNRIACFGADGCVVAGANSPDIARIDPSARVGALTHTALANIGDVACTSSACVVA